MQERKKPVGRGVASRGGKANSPAGGVRNSGHVKRKSSMPAVPAAKACASESQTHACPECGKRFRTDEAVQTHRHASHGTAATVVGDMTRCSECGSLVKNAHMATHLRREHRIV